MSLRLIAFGRNDIMDSTGEFVPVYEPKIYMLYEANEAVGSGGQTAAFNWWCEQIARCLIGLDLTKIKSNPDQFIGTPFYELLSYPAGKGTFGLTVCRKLAYDFSDPIYQNRAISADATGGTGFKMGFDKWAAAFLWAAANAGYLSFGMSGEEAVPHIMKISSNGYLIPEPLDNDSQVRMRQRKENQARLMAPKTEIFASSPAIHPVIETTPTITLPVTDTPPAQTTPVPLAAGELIGETTDPTRPVTRLPVTPEMVPVPPDHEPLVAAPVTVVGLIPEVPTLVPSLAPAVAQPRAVLPDAPVAPLITSVDSIYKPGDIIKIRVLDKNTGRNTPITGTVSGFAPNGDLIIQTPDGPLVAALSPATLKEVTELYQEKPRQA